MPACGATHMRFLLFLVKHVHVLGIQVIAFTLERVFQRDLLCLPPHPPYSFPPLIIINLYQVWRPKNLQQDSGHFSLKC